MRRRPPKIVRAVGKIEPDDGRTGTAATGVGVAVAPGGGVGVGVAPGGGVGVGVGVPQSQSVS